VGRHELTPSARQVLLNNLPADWRGACGEIVDSWGTELTGTDQWCVRILYRQLTQVWLAFRCGSHRHDLAQSYDERLGLLRLDGATLELLPLGPEAENDSDLYQLEFAEHLALEGAEGFAFRVTTGDNPCCDGPESRSQQRLAVFTQTLRGLTESLSVVTRRDDSSHSDNPDVDSETTYRAEVKFDRDTRNLVTAATSIFREEVKDITWESGTPEPHTVSQRSGTLRYRWNPTTFSFEEVK